MVLRLNQRGIFKRGEGEVEVLGEARFCESGTKVDFECGVGGGFISRESLGIESLFFEPHFCRESEGAEIGVDRGEVGSTERAEIREKVRIFRIESVREKNGAELGSVGWLGGGEIETKFFEMGRDERIEVGLVFFFFGRVKIDKESEF